MKISIIVLTYNGYDYLNQLLMDIRRNCAGVHEVIVVDNASEDDMVISGLSFWKRIQALPLRVVRLPDNVGFIGGMNIGLKKYSGDVAVLLSNDVRILSPKFLSSIESIITENRASLIGGTVYTNNTGWNFVCDKVYPYAEGYCLVATREFWDLVGGFDTRYSPSDFEDVDLSTQALDNGYLLVELPKNTVRHLGGKTYGYTEERANRTRLNQQKFIEKWCSKI